MFPVSLFQVQSLAGTSFPNAAGQGQSSYEGCLGGGEFVGVAGGHASPLHIHFFPRLDKGEEGQRRKREWKRCAGMS